MSETSHRNPNPSYSLTHSLTDSPTHSLTHSLSRSSLFRRGQASLEMTVALMGTLLLLFGSVKVFLWMVERLVVRQQSYETTRVAAGGDEPGKRWNEPTAPLRIFNE